MRGELLALKWQGVNFAESTLYVRRARIVVTGRGIIETEPKTAKGRRSIHLPPLAIEALKKHRVIQVVVRWHAEIWQEHDLIFCTSRGTPFIATYVHGVFKALLEEGEFTGYLVSRVTTQCSDAPSLHGHPSQVRTRVGGSQPDQHDDGHLLACDTHHAEGRDGEAG